MAGKASKVGRNELCECGSGLKSKRCCGADTAADDASGRYFQVASVLAGLMLVVGLLIAARALLYGNEDAGSSVRRTTRGRASSPLEAKTPVPGALQGLREAERQAAEAKASDAK